MMVKMKTRRSSLFVVSGACNLPMLIFIAHVLLYFQLEIMRTLMKDEPSWKQHLARTKEQFALGLARPYPITTTTTTTTTTTDPSQPQQQQQQEQQEIGFDIGFTRFDLARKRSRELAKPFYAYFDSEKAQRLAKKDPESNSCTWALASLALNTQESVARANQLMRAELTEILQTNTRDSLETSVEGTLTWRMRTWNRIYYLYGSKSKLPSAGRIDPDIDGLIEKVFYWFAWKRSSLEIANLRNIWFIEDLSENHDIMMKMNCYLAVQALANIPDYKNMTLSDGYLPSQHLQAWKTYFEHYAFERAKLGLLVEAASPPYGKWIMGEIVNIYEFAESARVRELFEMLMHAMWADFAIDQYQANRVGPKARCYPNYAHDSRRDSYSMMAQQLLGLGQMNVSDYGMQSTLILFTSKYELPDVIMDIVFNKNDYEPFVYSSSRPANKRQFDYKPSGMRGNWMDPTGGKVIRYSYHTQTFNMGSWLIDSGLDYAQINAQNRFHGVSFPTSTLARVYPWSIGHAQSGRTSYDSHVAVQHRNAMLVRNNARKQEKDMFSPGQLRVFFPEYTRGNLIEHNGWVIMKEGDAWLAVRVLNDGEHPNTTNYVFQEEDRTTKWVMDGYWMWPDTKSPGTFALFVACQAKPHKGLLQHYETLEDFTAYLAQTKLQITNGHGTFSFVDDTGKHTEMEIGLKSSLPVVNGKPLNLDPDKVFDSPWMTSDKGSGVIKVTKGDREMLLDFRPQDVL